MKRLLAVFIMLASTNAMACLDPELEAIAEISFITDLATQLPNAGLKVNAKLRRLVTSVIDLSDRECPNNLIATKSFYTTSGKLYHAVHTNDDACDGGNSYGVVLDANLQVVANIEDATFTCKKKNK